MSDLHPGNCTLDRAQGWLIKQIRLSTLMIEATDDEETPRDRRVSAYVHGRETGGNYEPYVEERGFGPTMGHALCHMLIGVARRLGVESPATMEIPERVPPGDPSYDGFRMEGVWAVTTIDPADNQEALPAILRNPFAPDAPPMPFIAADERRVESLRPQLPAIAGALGQQIKLVKFTRREDLEVIDP